LQCVAVCRSVSQYVAVCCSVLQCAAVCCSVLQCVAVCRSLSQCVAVCRSVLQCVAVCCSVPRVCRSHNMVPFRLILYTHVALWECRCHPRLSATVCQVSEFLSHEVWRVAVCVAVCSVAVSCSVPRMEQSFKTQRP